MSGKLNTAGQDKTERGRNGRATNAAPPRVLQPAEGSDTMAAWERFLTGDPHAAMPVGNYVVSSWLRSKAHGIDPTGRAAPLAVRGDAISRLREQHWPLISAAQDIFHRTAEMLVGARSIMLLTNADGVVLEIVGDRITLEQGERINLTRGGDWREEQVGTNGIGTALATARPAQVHAAEHYCEGIKAWTCAAAPVFDPTTGAILGVVDISGPPNTYQRTNLNLAVATAREIEAVLAERDMRERARLFEACLQRLSGADVGGLIAIDRRGTLLHATGRVAMPVGLGQRIPGLHDRIAVADWAKLLPQEWKPEWFDPVRVDGEAIGALLVVPAPKPRGTAAAATCASESDPGRMGFAAIIGESPPMQALIARARTIAARQVPVLIEGETGTGKELLARALHGERDAATPFVVFNCGAVTKDLVAAELFGHVRGAFTGATDEGRAGRFELAHGGVLCLDEIGEMPLDVQPFLLRALEEGVIYRVGDTRPRQVDVRLVSMTNRRLQDDVASGRFRRDLFYRIGVTRLHIPPLRERGADIVLLADHFVRKLAAKHGIPPRGFDEAARAALMRHDWPGNARELRNLVESLLLMTEAPEITAEHVAAVLTVDPPAPSAAATALSTTPGTPPGTPPWTPPGMPPGTPPGTPPATLEVTERAAITRALADTGHNVAEAARLLGISRSTLYRKAQRYGLPM
jgi:transcriptional regulator of acetoin/glycerol metabolism